MGELDFVVSELPGNRCRRTALSCQKIYKKFVIVGELILTTGQFLNMDTSGQFSSLDPSVRFFYLDTSGRFSILDTSSQFSILGTIGQFFNLDTGG